MLPKVKNEQTLRILERLRQRMPTKSAEVPDLMPEEEEEEVVEQPDQDGVVTDTSLPASPALAAAKKKLGRRY